ncbi:MAG TPA: carbon-nitrogen hydrolase family protein [Candidatus Acidoferrum sp.]|nr:carbon-nitrogen hydrolase family protein [Candidatus Acidoferrum sp.]
MSRSIRVAAVQLRAHARADFESSIDTIVQSVASAASDADLVVLPEGTLPAYVLERDDVDDTAIATALSRLALLAGLHRCAIVVGAAQRCGDTLRNAAVVIDVDGRIAGRADKLFLWHFDHRWFSPGETIAPVQTSIGRMGVMICADGRIPTIARTLVDRGAEILVMPTAWVTSGRNPHQLENVQADLLARVRARENRVPFVAANKCGVELGCVAYCGKSQIVDALGNVVAIADQHQPEILRAGVAMGHSPQRAPHPAPASRESSIAPAVRVAFGIDERGLDVARAMQFLGADLAVTPQRGIGAIDAVIPTVAVSDDDVHDPGVLAAFRRAGYRAFVWTCRETSAWTESLARARALELRVYAVVFDSLAGRAFAVDPDGIVIAGTFGDFQLAMFSLDPRRTAETTVAPETDVLEGLERAGAIAGERYD